MAGWADVRIDRGMSHACVSVRGNGSNKENECLSFPLALQMELVARTPGFGVRGLSTSWHISPSPDPRRLMTTPSRITLSPKGERVN